MAPKFQYMYTNLEIPVWLPKFWEFRKLTGYRISFERKSIFMELPGFGRIWREWLRCTIKMPNSSVFWVNKFNNTIHIIVKLFFVCTSVIHVCTVYRFFSCYCNTWTHFSTWMLSKINTAKFGKYIYIYSNSYSTPLIQMRTKQVMGSPMRPSLILKASNYTSI